MKVIAITADIRSSQGQFIVQMSQAEMMRVLGESYLTIEKLPAVGAEVKLAKAWDLVTYIRDRQKGLEQLSEKVAAIQKTVDDAIEDVATPLIVQP